MTEPSTPNDVRDAAALARIEVKLDTVIEAGREAKTTLEQHSRDIVDHGTRLTKLEAVNQSTSDNANKTYTGKQLAATSTAAGAALAGVVTTILRASGRG